MFRPKTTGRANSSTRDTDQQTPVLHSAEELPSGNLTYGGLIGNYECGLFIDDPSVVGSIEHEMLAYATLGADIDRPTLERYCEVAAEIRRACEAEVYSISDAARRRLSNALREANDQLIRVRLSGGALHTLFARTILFLLERDGPMETSRLHSKIQGIHPDLCDDLVDRVIDGKRFGKKWKHAVRTAQQQLKKRGLIRLGNSSAECKTGVC